MILRASLFGVIFFLGLAAKAQEDGWWEAVNGVSMPSLVADGWEIRAFERLVGRTGRADIYILQHPELPGAWRCLEDVDVVEGSSFSCEQLTIPE